MKSIRTNFKFKTYKEQIEKECFRLKRSWEEERRNEINSKYRTPKDPGEPYGFVVSMKIYNIIREIYLSDFPFPQDTKEILGLKIGILKKREESEIIIVNKEIFLKLTGDLQWYQY